ncbi:hypothetical protein [Lactococcus lactis]|uniref:hypothetical protein n=1 Tax=Lactococcus lactis TaxID=1358 RepID=UPI000C9EDFA9|nr:hypothetical protein [Lactococcus lactis]AUS68787.1 hypothetical protein LLG50_01315 [Lactococcus lactis subsp. lactis]
MYLKKVDSQKAKNLSDRMPFTTGTWYLKMIDNGTVAKNCKGQTLYICMASLDLQIALESKEFTHVEY